MQIIFVCTGNTCRSPMAEGILKSKNIDGLYVFSRGLYVPGEQSASFSSEKAMSDMGIDISSHKSKQLTMDEAKRADLILTMTKSHKNTIISADKSFEGKVFTLSEFAGESGDVADPFGYGEDVYFDIAQHIEYLIDKIDWNKINDKKSENQ